VTTSKVRSDVVCLAVGYVASLLTLLLWPNRVSADQILVLLVGMATLILVGMTVAWLAFHWRPSSDLLEFVTQTGYPNRRPLRYSIPNFLGLMAAFVLVDMDRSNGATDWGLIAYALGAPLLLAGLSASNLWWALATKSGSGDVTER
jgi:hypothetical protein